MKARRVAAGRAYVLDVIYTHEPMEQMKKWVAESHFIHQIDNMVVKNNNNGHNFERNVEKILWQVYHTGIAGLCRQQRQNKESRILTQAVFVQRNVLFPTDWSARWQRFYAAMSGYLRKGYNPNETFGEKTLSGRLYLLIRISEKNPWRVGAVIQWLLFHGSQRHIIKTHTDRRTGWWCQDSAADSANNFTCVRTYGHPASYQSINPFSAPV